jgi:hypothetical protein
VNPWLPLALSSEPLRPLGLLPLNRFAGSLLFGLYSACWPSSPSISRGSSQSAQKLPRCPPLSSVTIPWSGRSTCTVPSLLRTISAGPTPFSQTAMTSLVLPLSFLAASIASSMLLYVLPLPPLPPPPGAGPTRT